MSGPSSHRASDEAVQAAASGEFVPVDYAAGIWSFVPRVTDGSGARLVFFPGALVDPRAYAPLARAVAGAGYEVTIIEVPRRGAFGGAESAKLAERVGAALRGQGGRPVVVGGPWSWEATRKVE